jgi:hypothetical protein
MAARLSLRDKRLHFLPVDDLANRLMTSDLLSSRDAAEALGVSVSTLYDWLAQSDAGQFEIRGQLVTIDYFQGGRRGQGRIKIAGREIERLLSLMRVVPSARPTRQLPKKRSTRQHITTKLGRPDD